MGKKIQEFAEIIDRPTKETTLKVNLNSSLPAKPKDPTDLWTRFHVIIQSK